MCLHNSKLGNFSTFSSPVRSKNACDFTRVALQEPAQLTHPGALGAPEAMLWHTLWVALQHCLSDGLRALRQQLIRDQGYKLNVTPVLSHVYQKSVKLYPERDVR